MDKIIYLDNAATTKPLKAALENAAVYNDEMFYNPSALYHGGLAVRKAVEEGRKSLSSLFGGNFDPVFLSCGTEADNTVIASYAKRGNIVTTEGEHSAIYAPAQSLKNAGYDVRFATLDRHGGVNEENLLSLIDKNTQLVSVVHVNNETGEVNDINKIAARAKSINKNLIFHSDGVQAFCKIPFRPSDNIDFYSVSAHKIGGLKGTGILFKNKKVRNLKPLVLGGGQENGLRSGTENVFGIKVTEYAAAYRYSRLQENYRKIADIKKAVLNALDKNIFEVISGDNSSPYVLTVSAVGLRGEVIQHALEKSGIIVGTGSACSSKHPHSRMLKSIGYSEKELDGVIRISFSPESELSNALFAAEKLNEAATELKRTIYNLK